MLWAVRTPPGSSPFFHNTEATEPPEFPAAAATEPPKASEQPEENADAGKYIGKSTSSAVEATWSKIDSYECDINSDGAE